MRAGLSNERFEVQTPDRAEIWIEIYVPCTPLLRLWDHKSVDSRASPSWEERGENTLVIKRRHERNPTTQEQRRKPENTKTWKKVLDTNGQCA